MAAESHASIDPAATRVVSDIPCPFCGCVCDDLQATVVGERVASIGGACELARPWFLGDRAGERPECRIAGRPAEMQDALQHAAELLGAARYPLVYGLGRATCEAQGAAVEIAELLRGVLDTPASRASLGALQSVGDVTCTLGELRNRADLIVVWGADPVATHPRFFERYGPASHTCQIVAIDSRPMATGGLAGQRIAVRSGAEFDAALVLRGLAKGLPMDAEQLAERTGVSLAAWRALWERMKAARFGVLLLEDSRDSLAARRLHEALAALVRELNRHTRFASLTLNSSGNIGGAQNVLAWRTGYATAVDFSRGYPRSDPNEFAAEKLLASGEVDAALIVCDDPLSRFDRAALERFRAIPTAVVDWQASATFAAASVAIPVAVPGVESGGTVFRMDGVPLTLRPVSKARWPADHEALSELKSAIATSRGLRAAAMR